MMSEKNSMVNGSKMSTPVQGKAGQEPLEANTQNYTKLKPSNPLLNVGASSFNNCKNRATLSIHDKCISHRACTGLYSWEPVHCLRCSAILHLFKHTGPKPIMPQLKDLRDTLFENQKLLCKYRDPYLGWTFKSMWEKYNLPNYLIEEHSDHKRKHTEIDGSVSSWVSEVNSAMSKASTSQSRNEVHTHKKTKLNLGDISEKLDWLIDNMTNQEKEGEQEEEHSNQSFHSGAKYSDNHSERGYSHSRSRSKSPSSHSRSNSPSLHSEPEGGTPPYYKVIKGKVWLLYEPNLHNWTDNNCNKIEFQCGSVVSVKRLVSEGHYYILPIEENSRINFPFYGGKKAITDFAVTCGINVVDLRSHKGLLGIPLDLYENWDLYRIINQLRESSAEYSFLYLKKNKIQMNAVLDETNYDRGWVALFKKGWESDEGSFLDWVNCKIDAKEASRILKLDWGTYFHPDLITEEKKSKINLIEIFSILSGIQIALNELNTLQDLNKAKVTLKATARTILFRLRKSWQEWIQAKVELRRIFLQLVNKTYKAEALRLLYSDLWVPGLFPIKELNRVIELPEYDPEVTLGISSSWNEEYKNGTITVSKLC